MPPPLLSLQDIHLTFGTTPLLSGAGLSVSAGDRVCLVGRNGSGKSILLRIAGGLMQSDSGRRFAQPGATIRYLPQEPDFSEFPTTLAYVEAGFDAGAAGDHHRASYLLEQLGLNGTEDPSLLSGGEARRAALARVLAPEPDILLLDQSSRSAGHRVAGARIARSSFRDCADQPRPAAAGALVARYRLARPRHHAATRGRIFEVRSLAR
jgi:ATP-binding cassette subfamily F protein uup